MYLHPQSPLNPSQLPITLTIQKGNQTNGDQPIIGTLLNNNTSSFVVVESGGTVIDYIPPAGQYVIQYGSNGTLTPPQVTLTFTANSPLVGTITITVYQIGDTLPNSTSSVAPVPSFDGQLLLGTIPVSTFTNAQELDFTFPIPSGEIVNALGLFLYVASGSTGGYKGIRFLVENSSQTLSFYDARPFANYIDNGYNPTPPIPGIVPYPALIYGSPTIRMISTITSKINGTIDVIGFTSIIPNQPDTPVPAKQANTTSINGSVQTLLPTLTDGRRYRIWSVNISAYGSTLNDASLDTSSGNIIQLNHPASNVPAQTNVSYPAGNIIDAGPIQFTEQAASGAATVNITYDYV